MGSGVSNNTTTTRRAPRRRGHLSWGAFVAGFLLAATAQSASAQVSGRVVRVGLFAGARQTVRVGEYSFVEVELRYTGAAPFDGKLRVDQSDCDGDVAHCLTPVALVPTGEARSYFVYFVPQSLVGGESIRVQLLDAAGKLTSMTDDKGQSTTSLVSDPYFDMSGDELLIVDLTVPRKLPHVSWLDSDRLGGPVTESFNRRKVRAMTPSELPNRWYGLEPVDAIVWDDADPTNLSDQQAQALMDWVRNGGRLCLTAGKNWQALTASPLMQILPVTISGASAASEALEFSDLIGEELYNRLDLGREYMKRPFTRCQMTPLPDALRIPSSCPGELPRIAFRRMVGRGVVTFVGAPLIHLVPPPGKFTNFDAEETPDPADLRDTPFMQFCERVLARNFLALPPQRKMEDTNLIPGEINDLFGLVRRSIQFGSQSAAFLLFAFVYALMYIGAGAGSYFYLKKKSMLHHCWTAFALVGVAGSVIGTGMVWTLRGVRKHVWQTTILDAHAGEDFAYGACLAGLKTPDHTQLDITLPIMDHSTGLTNGGGPLRVIPRLQSMSEDTTFVAPESYSNTVLGTSLLGVPHRATLKEYQGIWQGPLGGTVEGRLIIRRPAPGEPFEFADGSFIKNQLGVDLKDCYLLETNDDGEFRSVNCHILKDLPKSGSESEIKADRLRQRLNYLPPDPAKPNDPPKRRSAIEFLVGKSIGDWERQVSKALITSDDETGAKRARLEGSDEHYALLLLSCFDLIQQEDGRGVNRLRRSLGRRLNCTQQLSRHTAILIGYAESTPPARLEIDGDAMKPSKSHTMYRILLPVER